MKNIIAFALVASLALPTAAVAGPYDYQGQNVHRSYERGDYRGYNRGDYRGYDRRPRHERRERNGNRWVVPALVGLIVGATVVSSTRKNQDYRPANQDEVYRQPAPRTYVYDYRCDCYR
jgi:hypothetical protein